MSTTKLTNFGAKKSLQGSLTNISVEPGIMTRGKTASHVNRKDRRYIEINEYQLDQTTAGNSSGAGLMSTYHTTALQNYRSRGGKVGPV